VAQVVAAVDGSAVSRSVLRTAASLAELLGGAAEALYVGQLPAPDVERVVAESGLPLRCVPGEPQAVISQVLASPDVRLGVLGARGTRTGRRPAGRAAAGQTPDTTNRTGVRYRPRRSGARAGRDQLRPL